VGHWFTGVDLALYIHIPYCVRKCRYCDFVSFSYSREDADAYLRALFGEIERWGELLKASEIAVGTVYIGGGTPTCLDGAGLARLIEKIHRCFHVRAGAEITVEVNPGTIDYEKLVELRIAGVNRLSLGVQSFNDGLLRCLGRIHTGEEAKRAIDLVEAAGFGNFNVDLIFGIPGQTEELWLYDLEQVKALEPTHISAYDLIVEEGTLLFDLIESHTLELPGEELSLRFYECAMDELVASGYVHYEISNFAKPGCECLHNKVYWTNGEYLGLGLAAYSSASGRRWHNYLSLSRYVQTCNNDLPIEEIEVLDVPTQMWETVFMGLRMLRQGVSFSDFQARFGIRLDEVYEDVICRLEHMGLIRLLQDRMLLSKQGLCVGNQVFSEFALDG
jgi:oxygen-independent coproporphyrinogen-3 oxidase